MKNMTATEIFLLRVEPRINPPIRMRAFQELVVNAALEQTLARLANLPEGLPLLAKLKIMDQPFFK